MDPNCRYVTLRPAIYNSKTKSSGMFGDQPTPPNDAGSDLIRDFKSFKIWNSPSKLRSNPLIAILKVNPKVTSSVWGQMSESRPI